MKAVDDARGRAYDDDATATLLAEFRTWLDRERSLSPVSVRCYGAQTKTFLVGVGGADVVGGLDAGKVVAFMVDHARDRNTWSAGDGDVAADVPAVRVCDRADGGADGGCGPGGRVVAAVDSSTWPFRVRD